LSIRDGGFREELADQMTDGEDVLTPLILKAADSILTEVTRK
jgi:hypothetical protein